jgi:hypothetical protein
VVASSFGLELIVGSVCGGAVTQILEEYQAAEKSHRNGRVMAAALERCVILTPFPFRLRKCVAIAPQIRNGMIAATAFERVRHPNAFSFFDFRQVCGHSATDFSR